MIHPIPSGTRDVLPEETREVRAITNTLLSVFERHGYGEVYTPAVEYESVLTRADMADAEPAYRVFDETGAVLVLRSDMTAPIARVVATRYAGSEPPLRFCYFAHCYRGVRPQRGQPRELLQAGIELIGAAAPEGTAEALTLLCHSLDAVGLRGYRVGLGDASLFPALMRSLQVRQEAQTGLLEALVRRGAPIAGGARYDELLARWGRRLPAVGFALGVDRLHMALAGEERGTGALLARAGTRAGE